MAGKREAPRTPSALKAFRKAQGLAQSAVADIVQTTQSQVSRAERGKLGTRLPADWIEALQRWLESGAAVESPDQIRVPTRGRALRSLRYSRGMKPGKAARIMGVSARTISRWERDDAVIPDDAREALRCWIRDKEEGVVPRTGADLEEWIRGVQEEDPSATLSKIAKGIGVSSAVLKEHLGAEVLPESFRVDLRRLFRVQAPQTGVELKVALKELAEDGIPPEQVAAGLNMKSAASLRTYTYKKKLPEPFRERWEAYFQ